MRSNEAYLSGLFNKVIAALFSVAIFMFGFIVMQPSTAHAASPGVYVATATPHYAHPNTGKIEDSGGSSSAVLGQSMTESATSSHALVEVDSAGNTYVTVRLLLMDNIKNPQFSVDGSTVSAKLMQENASRNSADYRMRVNGTNSVIRCSMYVSAMGRDVVFYITVGNLKAGHGDFIVSLKNATSQKTNQTGASAKSASGTSQNNNNGDVSSVSDEGNGGDVAQNSNESAGVNAETLADSEEQIEDNSDPLSGGMSEEGDNTIWLVIDGVLAVAVIGAAAWYFTTARKRKRLSAQGGEK